MPAISKSLEDYLEMIYILIRDRRYARVRDVAGELKVKMPSVVKAISELKKLEFVKQEPYGDIELTPKGKRYAASVLSRHTILHSFLLSLGVSDPVADRDACSMEHILSAETMDKIKDFLKKNPPPAKKPADASDSAS